MSVHVALGLDQQKVIGFRSEGRFLSSRIRRVVILGIVAILAISQPAEAKWGQRRHFRGGAVKDFAVKDGALFVAIAESGVFLSKDQGASWNTANTGLPPQAFVECLSRKRQGHPPRDLQIRDLRFRDNGASWKASNSGLPQETEIKDIVVNGTSILAATAAGVYLSTDRGASWAPMDEGLANGPAGLEFGRAARPRLSPR